MLFNSYPFVFVFLPVTLAGFFLIARASHTLAAGWLTLASLAFYGWWNPAYVVLLVLSIVFNFAVGARLARLAGADRAAAKRWLAFGVGVDLALLGYYKYTGFLLGNWNAITGTAMPVPDIALPLGISFFTFTQIAFLADAYQGLVREYRPVHYALFVTYFPHLIAGPVLHHKEMMPQFGHASTYRWDWENLAVGFTVFFIGLFKKTVLADGIAEYARAPFAAAAAGQSLPLLDAWGGALAYTFQLYFDFSGYSDMAIGLSRMVGVRLPLNFDSPYKASSIIDFWRRWHMTLSRFLRDYLYIPLGGNRRGAARRYVNLAATMVLGGLWHGANWTFVVWGALHGLYLFINHAWRATRLRARLVPLAPAWARHALAVALTFLATVVGWVFFRAESLGAARAMLEGMAGLHGVVMPYPWLGRLGGAGVWLAAHGVEFRHSTTFAGGGQVNWILIALLIVWAAPNTQQILSRFPPALGMADPSAVARRWWHWRPHVAWLAFVLVAATAAILSLTEVSEFIYFQF
jgi:D-alanyl-lipoteichoic acid acyltransferase DltB (MBOAT superfamily)